MIVPLARALMDVARTHARVTTGSEAMMTEIDGVAETRDPAAEPYIVAFRMRLRNGFVNEEYTITVTRSEDSR